MHRLLPAAPSPWSSPPNDGARRFPSSLLCKGEGSGEGSFLGPILPIQSGELVNTGADCNSAAEPGPDPRGFGKSTCRPVQPVSFLAILCIHFVHKRAEAPQGRLNVFSIQRAAAALSFTVRLSPSRCKPRPAPGDEVVDSAPRVIADPCWTSNAPMSMRAPTHAGNRAALVEVRRSGVRVGSPALMAGLRATARKVKVAHVVLQRPASVVLSDHL